MWFTSFPFPFDISAVKAPDLTNREPQSATAVTQNASPSKKERAKGFRTSLEELWEHPRVSMSNTNLSVMTGM